MVNSVSIGLNEVSNTIRKIDMIPVKNVSIISNEPKIRTDLMCRLLDSFLDFDDIKNIKLFILDESKTLFQSLNVELSNFTLKYSYDLKEILILTEVIYEEVKNRLRILKDNDCDDLNSYEIKMKTLDSSYNNPPYFYIVINDLDILRLRLAEKSEANLEYFDYLLTDILKFSTKVNIGFIFSNRNTLNKYYPKDFYKHITHKLGKNLITNDYQVYFDINKSSRNFLPDYDKIYLQERYSSLEKLDDSLFPKKEIIYNGEDL